MDISSIADESELTRIGVKKVEFDKKIQAIKSKYGISVKIGEASDTLYAT